MSTLFDNLPRVVDGYEISSGLPIVSDKQDRKRREWTPPRFPFHALREGDSFDVRPMHGLSLIETQNLVSGQACGYRKNHGPRGWNFTTRQMNGFVRCWRRDNEREDWYE